MQGALCAIRDQWAFLRFFVLFCLINGDDGTLSDGGAHGAAMGEMAPATPLGPHFQSELARNARPTLFPKAETPLITHASCGDHDLERAVTWQP